MIIISKLNHENYHHTSMGNKYMSVSLFKSLTPWQPYACQAKSIAVLDGEYVESTKPAYLLGNYVHSFVQGTLNEFTTKHPELFKKNGELYAKYKTGDDMINTLKNDEYISKALAGGKERIFTGNLFNVDWKIMIDVHNPDTKTFSDLKTTREIRKRYYNSFMNEYQTMIEYFGYDVQMAIYAEIERLANGRPEGDYYIPHIIAVSKEKPPDKMVIHFPTGDWIKEKLEMVEAAMADVIPVWKREKEPERCERCSYCRSTKQIKKSVHYLDFIKND